VMFGIGTSDPYTVQQEHLVFLSWMKLVSNFVYLNEY